MKNLLNTYYDGITQQIKSEFEFVNNYIEHQGEKGGANERILQELIIKFLPKKFGVGSGIIIDQDGKQAKQSDLIIYDTYLYPMIVGLTATHLFPIDIVYATIEIKTTLDSKSAMQAVENIQSIKKLNYIKNPFPNHGSSQNTALSVRFEKPTPPIGCIFGYKTHCESFKTFQEWFVSENNYHSMDHNVFPELIVSMDQGMISKLVSKKLGTLYPCTPLPLLIDGNFIGSTNHPDIFNEQKEKYPKSKIDYEKGGDFLIDETKVFLSFLLTLNIMFN